MYCPFNQALDCIRENDEPRKKCGWNPDVDQERRKKTRERHEKDVLVSPIEPVI